MALTVFLLHVTGTYVVLLYNALVGLFKLFFYKCSVVWRSLLIHITALSHLVRDDIDGTYWTI